MQLIDILTLDRVVPDLDVSSKKRILEVASATAAKTLNDINANEIYDRLLARERLGTTAIGHGIAIPHCRIAELPQAIAVLLRLQHGVDFDAADQEAVDLVLTLLVPEDSPEEHLQLLANIAGKFNDPTFREQLRNATDVSSLYKIVTAYD